MQFANNLSWVLQLRVIGRRRPPQNDTDSVDWSGFSINDHDALPKEQPVGMSDSSCASSVTLQVGNKPSQSMSTATAQAPSIIKAQTQGIERPETPAMFDSLGLNIVHDCSDPLVDLIFVHGLGGAPVKTWSWQRDPQNCWLPWLGKEAEIGSCRIFTFGYNADFPGQHTRLNILDFAKELLFGLKTYSHGRAGDGRLIGNVSVRLLFMN